MSPSSSGSWSGAPDIIDLDRYMRGNVRPSRTSTDSKFGRLVVDGGGVGEVCYASSRSACEETRYKRASHDSGVSDGSYRRNKRHQAYHRRYSNHTRPPVHDPKFTKTLSVRERSNTSLNAFRTLCEKALLDQQRQIARVTEICEKLAERSEKPNRVEKPQCERSDRTASVARSKRKRKVQPSEGTSEISSSSRSSNGPWKNGEKYNQQCKTYKIIMNKLDELSRRVVPRPAPPAPPSVSSVSVCDKVVATDPQRTYNKILAPSQHLRSPDSSFVRSPRLSHARTVTQAFAVDIAPKDARHNNNVITESINKCESISGGSRRSACDPRCGFDLDDPVHLYSQAKRLQSNSRRERVYSATCEKHKPVHEETRTKHSKTRLNDTQTRLHDSQTRLDDSQTRLHDSQIRLHDSQTRFKVSRNDSQSRQPSLCAVCRGYWRYFVDLYESWKCS